MSLHLSSHSPSPSLPLCSFSCRIVSIEHYTASPLQGLDVCYSSFRSSAVDKVPVIRIFGSTPAGQKTCLHVHGVFPYMYVPCRHGDPNDEYLQVMARSIDHAIQLAMGSSSRSAHHVFKIVLVKGKPFYGYHGQEHLFLKIYLYNPALIKRLSELLVAGAVMGEVLQPHESHVPFVLQFMIDHNLFGMGHIHLSDVKFRIVGSGRVSKAASPAPGRRGSASILRSPSPSPSLSSSSFLFNPSQTIWDMDTLSRDKVVSHSRVSVCELEADAVAGDILNRHELSLVSEGFPGLAALWEEERLRRKDRNMDTPLTPPSSPSRTSQVNADCESRLQDELEAILQERFSQSLNSSLLGSSCREDSNSSQLVHNGSATGAGNVKEERNGLSDRATSSLDGITSTDSVVDEETVLRTVRLSQRCSADAVEKSSSKELVDLLNELCRSNDDISASQLLAGQASSSSPSQQLLQSQALQPDVLPRPFQPDTSRPPHSDLMPLTGHESVIQPSQAPPPLSQSHSTTSQSLGERMLDKICRRSISVRSGSLFSTPSPSPPPTQQHSRGEEKRGDCLNVDARAPVGLVATMSKAVVSTTSPTNSSCKSSGSSRNLERLSKAASPEGRQASEMSLDKGADDAEEVDEIFLAASEYDISCAQESHTPLTDVGLWEVQERGTESPDNLSIDVQDKEVAKNGEKFGVETEYDMENIFSLECPDSGGSSIGDFLEASPPWNVPSSLERQLLWEEPQIGEGRGSSEFPVLTSKTRRKLVRLIISSQEEGDEVSENDEEEEEEEEEELGEEFEGEDSATLKAIWDEIDTYRIEIPDDLRIPQLDGIGDNFTKRKSKGASVAATTATTKPVKTSRGRLGVRRNMRTSAKSASVGSSGCGQGEVVASGLQVGLETSEVCGPGGVSEGEKPRVGGHSGEETGEPGVLKEADAMNVASSTNKMEPVFSSPQFEAGDSTGADSKEELAPSLPPPRKRGRPRKSKPSDAKHSDRPSSLENSGKIQNIAESSTEEAFHSAKRRKRDSSVSLVEEKVSLPADVEACKSLSVEEVLAQLDSSFEATPKRKRGRPRLSQEEKERRLLRKGRLVVSSVPPPEEKGSEPWVVSKSFTSMDEVLCQRTRGRPRLALQSRDKRKQRTVSKNEEVRPKSNAVAKSWSRSRSAAKESISSSSCTQTSAASSEQLVSKRLYSALVARAFACQFNLRLSRLPVNSLKSCRLAHHRGNREEGEELTTVEKVVVAKKTRKGGRLSLKRRSKALSNSLEGGTRQGETTVPSRDDFSSQTTPPETGSGSVGHTLPSLQRLLTKRTRSGSDLESTTGKFSGCGMPLLVSPMKCDVATSDSDTGLCGQEVLGGQENSTSVRTDFSLIITSDSDAEMDPKDGKDDAQQEVGSKTQLEEESLQKEEQRETTFRGSSALLPSPVAADELVAIPESSSPPLPPPLPPPLSFPMSPGTVPSLSPVELANMPAWETVKDNGKEVSPPPLALGVGQDQWSETKVWCPLIPPLSWKDLSESSRHYRLPSMRHRKPFFGNLKDVQSTKRVGGKSLRVQSNLPSELKEFSAPYLEKSDSSLFSQFGLKSLQLSLETQQPGVIPIAETKKIIITPAQAPPSPRKLNKEVQAKLAKGGGQDQVVVETGRVVEKNGVDTPALIPSLNVSAAAKKEEDNSRDVTHELERDSCCGQLPYQNCEGGRGKNLSLSRRTTPDEKDTSQLDGPTPANSCGFKVNQSVLCSSNDIHEVQHLTCLSVEVHAHTRGRLKPDPEFDPVLVVSYFVHHDWPREGYSERNSRLGVVAIDIHNAKFTSFVGKPPAEAPPSDSSHKDMPIQGQQVDKDLEGYLCRCGLSPDVEVTHVASERLLLEFLVDLIHDVDPDFLIGYEVVMSSWGYLIERAAAIDINLLNLISRIPQDSKPHPQVNPPPHHGSSSSSFGSSRRIKLFDLRVPGRIVLNVWRFMRHEVNLTSYTFESLCFHALHRRLPHFSHQTLTSWYNSNSKQYRYRVLEYYLERSKCNYVLLEKFNLIGRTSEFARLYGIEFENVANRGSQYKVESMMLRLAKPANFIAISPSIRQRTRMAAPECIPLVMEPESQFYKDPVILLDFQSLYPSIVIAYNLCFSTCLGRMWSLAQPGEYKFGTNSLSIPDAVLKKLRSKLHVSPNGVAYVKKSVRRGILPLMLEEILNTRIMVKSSMKAHKADKLLQRLLNSRQLALKLVANTTFGYSAATYSGRMPCIELADSIVQKGRETLERAINLVNSTPEWGGRVVYGDTDSLFVLVKGASKDEAFRIGREICEQVTAQNPKPVKLKLEKVYLPCILQSKKRYVGLSYESPDQATPSFDAKGIETVRRDNCPAVGKVLQKSLEILFKSRNVSLVKSYVQRQFRKLLEGNVNIQDFVIAKEYRGRDYYSPGASVPALQLTRQGLLVDRRSEPRQGERVPYVVVYGSPGLPLIQLVRRPLELLVPDSGLRLNASYYITKQLLPPLDRAFSLLGVDVREWYFDGPKLLRGPVQASKPPPALGGSSRARGGGGGGTIGHYFASRHCPLCSRLTQEGVCSSCRDDTQRLVVTLTVREGEDLRTLRDVTEICANCVGSRDSSMYLQCNSIDCPVLHRRFRAQQDLDISQAWRRLTDEL